MTHALICNCPTCRFVLDGHMHGGSPTRPRSLLKACPQCGREWSVACPFCSHPLNVKFIGGLPHSACCNRKLRSAAAA